MSQKPNSSTDTKPQLFVGVVKKILHHTTRGKTKSHKDITKKEDQ